MKGEEGKKEETKIPAHFEDQAINYQNHEFANSIDKILIAHRNTKFFLFCMSWQFFAVYYVVKKIF